MNTINHVTSTAALVVGEYVKAVEHFDYLYQRWQDESEYEDFNEYVESMKTRLPAGAREVRMHRRPFQLDYVLNGQRMYMRATREGVRYNEPRQS